MNSTRPIQPTLADLASFDDGSLASIHDSSPNLANYVSGLESTPLRIISACCSPCGTREENYHDPSSLDAMESWLDDAVRAAAQQPTISQPPVAGRRLHILFLNLRLLSDTLGVGWIEPMKPLERKLGIIRGQILIDQVRYLRHAGGPGECLSSISHIPESSSSSPCWKYSVNMPGIALTSWGFFPASESTIVIVGLELPASAKRVSNQLLLSRSLSFSSLGNPVAWSLVILHSCLKAALDWSSTHYITVMQVQKVTGMHSMTIIDDLVGDDIDGGAGGDGATPNLEHLTNKILRTSTDISVQEIRCKGYSLFAEFIRRENAAFANSQSSGSATLSTTDVQQFVAFAEATAALYHDEFLKVQSFANTTKGTCQFLLQGLQTFIAQRDQQATFRLANESKRIAEESKKLAEDSKNIAEDSWKDTTSMTAITIITMVFLPGTFTSVSGVKSRCVKHVPTN